jgi:metal-responsive CopG/Arc/MetJ family transcriptional regulator
MDEGLASLLDDVSSRTGRSRSEVARDALKRQLRVAQFDALRRRVMPFAEARGYLTDDDVFREIP